MLDEVATIGYGQSVIPFKVAEMKDRTYTVSTAERVREALDYDKDTGDLRWKIKTGSRGRIGAIAGCLNGSGYRVINLDGIAYRASHLAWVHVTGKWPVEEIDHENRKRDDDRWCNLKEKTSSQQKHNTVRRRDNSSGYRNISFFKPRQMWRVRIEEGGKELCCRYFGAVEQAVAERDKLRKEFGLPPAIDNRDGFEYEVIDGKQPAFVKQAVGGEGFFCANCGHTQFAQDGPMDFVTYVTPGNGTEILVCAHCRRALDFIKKDPDFAYSIVMAVANEPRYARPDYGDQWVPPPRRVKRSA